MRMGNNPPELETQLFLEICLMNSKWTLPAALVAAIALIALPGMAEVCTGFGPQTPRDIDSAAGTNTRLFSEAPGHQKMNLCNVHFHKQAENKAKDFSLSAGDGTYGGFRCNATADLTLSELRPLVVNHCQNVNAGDTIEVHWVHTSCDSEPGPTLNSCLDQNTCPNPTLRVETQVFLLVNDSSAMNFADFRSAGRVDGYYQAEALPSGTGKPVAFLGSTTGPSFSDEVCSPLQVSWSVRPKCAKLDIGSLSEWCSKNVFDEKKGHGVRQLVRDPSLLSKIGK